MVPSAHHASPTACVAGSSPPSTCPACPQPSGDPRPCIPRLSMAVVRHACSRSLSSFCAGYGIVAHRDDHLPQPCCRSDILDLLSVPEPVCCHRVSTPRVCRLCAPLLGRVPPVWALSCVTLRVLCACGWSVWQAPNPRLAATAPVTGWYWRDRIELSSCSGPHAVENPVSFEIRSGEVARWQDGDWEDCNGGCGHACGSPGGGRVGQVEVGDGS